MKHRRFVAGAVCPQCKQLDKTIVYEREERSFRECIACGHCEALDALGQQHELPTRVNSTENLAKEQSDSAAAELKRPVQIIDPRKT